jgi:hypothetical protein
MVAAARQAETTVAAGSGQREGRTGSWVEDPFGDLEEDASRVERRSSSSARSSGNGLPRRFRWLAKAAGMDPAIDRWAWLSPYHALGVMQAWIFGIETRPQAVVPSLVSLATVSLVALIVLLNRIDAPTRV